MVPLELRKRAFNRTIASIDKMLLGSTNDYLERLQGEKLPQSQIECTVSTIQCVWTQSAIPKTSLHRGSAVPRESSTPAGNMTSSFRSRRKRGQRLQGKRSFTMPMCNDIFFHMSFRSFQPHSHHNRSTLMKWYSIISRLAAAAGVPFGSHLLAIVNRLS